MSQIQDDATLTEAKNSVSAVQVPAPDTLLNSKSPGDDASLQPVIKTFTEILSLPPDWNSYGAPLIDPDCVKFILDELLPFVMHPDTPIPAVVPTVRRGVQLEWHLRGIDLEIEIFSPGHLYVVYDNHATGKYWEREIWSDLGPLVEPVRELSQSSQV